MPELEHLGREARDELGEPSPAWLRQQREGLRRAFVPNTSRSKAWAVGMALAAVLVALVVLTAFHFRAEADRPRETALSADGRPHREVLADGSVVILEAHTRARLTTQPTATRCVVELGTASFDVTPQGARAFTVSAGKYEVRVVGTRFSVSHSAAGVVEVQVRHGVVQVRAPERGAPLELRDGDYLRAADGSLSLGHPAPALAASVDAPPPVPVPQVVSSAGQVPPAATERGEPPRADWQQLYRERNYAAALAAARRLGIDGMLVSLSAQPLADLADAARLAGDNELALRVLASIERRFPTSRQASDATFLSGRILASRGQASRAQAQFEAYLGRNAQGPYSLEATGRLVELYAASGDARAKPMARAYLQRAPGGPYERLSRSVLAAP